ncbi:MAG: RidA family protein [Planctomycetota bacterium]
MLVHGHVHGLGDGRLAVTVEERHAAAGNVLSYDMAKQCRCVFDNVRTILEDAGARWEDIVDVTVFLTNMKADFPVFNKLHAEYFATNQPTRTTVEVAALPTPIAIELKVIAAVST